MRLKNLVGQTFGSYKVVSRAERQPGDQHAKWICECSHGHRRIIRSNDLGLLPMCGCLAKRKRDLIGRRFGRLTVISLHGRDANRNNQWRCVCDCGKEVTVISNSLLRGATKSCGCLKREKVSQANIARSKNNRRLAYETAT